MCRKAAFLDSKNARVSPAAARRTPSGRRFCWSCGAALAETRPRGRRAQGRLRPVRRPRRVHGRVRPRRSRGRPRDAAALPRRAETGDRAVRRHRREVHRRRGDGGVRCARRARGRRRARGALGAADPRGDRGAQRGASGLELAVRAASTPARRSSRSAPVPERAKASRPVTSSTRRRVCSSTPRSAASSSVRAPIAPRGTSSLYEELEPVSVKGKADALPIWRAHSATRPVRRGRRTPRRRSVHRARARARAAQGRVRARTARLVAAARHDDRRAWRRQDPVDLGVPELRRRARTRSSGGGRVAAFPTAKGLRSGRSARSSKRMSGSSSPTIPSRPARRYAPRSKRSSRTTRIATGS